MILNTAVWTCKDKFGAVFNDHECQGLWVIRECQRNRLILTTSVITAYKKCVGPFPVIDQLLDGIGTDSIFFRGQLPVILASERQSQVRQL